MSFKEIKEIIYFDLDKAISLYSQLQDGLTTEESSSSSSHEKINPEIGLNVLGLKVGLNGEKLSELQSTQTKILHHNILNRLESNLAQAGMLTLLSSFSTENSSQVFDQIKEASYVKASGPSTFENLRRLNKLMPEFNKTVDFLNMCKLSGIPKMEELIAQGMSKESAHKTISNLKKSIGKDKVEKIDDKMLKGMSEFFKDYLEERIIFRVQPLMQERDFQVRAQLKDACFLADDQDHISFCYGLNPKVELTILGLITSLPSPQDNDSYGYQPCKNIGGDSGEMEEKLRIFIEAFESLRGTVSFDRYPVVTVYPIAIYRSISYGNK